MLRSRRLNILTVFIAVCALLLEAAVPLLASAAAAMRGVPVAEVCEVYGVALPQADPHAHHHMPHMAQAGSEAADAHHGHGHDSTGAHKSDHCALLGLAALAPASATVSPQEAARFSFSADPPPAHGKIFDAAAQWAARLKHGPPAFA
jgi:uncharacterized protein involved in copper resistance